MGELPSTLFSGSFTRMRQGDSLHKAGTRRDPHLVATVALDLRVQDIGQQCCRLSLADLSACPDVYDSHT